MLYTHNFLNFQIVVGQKSLASLPVPWSLGGFKEETINQHYCPLLQSEVQLEQVLRTEKLRVKLKLSFPLCVQVLHWRDQVETLGRVTCFDYSM